MKNIKLMLSSVKRIVLFFVLMSFGLYATAQTTMEVSGTVKDDQGETVIGASVLEEGTTNGAVTDIDGNFKLKVKEGAKIRISYVGYNTVTLPARQNMVVKLEEAGNIMDELIVTGYTTQRRADLTGSVAVMNMDEPISASNPNMLSSMQGKLAGVTISDDAAPGGGSSTIRVRGMSTVNPNNSPLYIIDGVATTENLNSLNPADIESIQVLKDASSASIYGSRAANGVIIITTKQGKGDKLTVNVNYSLSLQTVAKTYDMLTAEQWGQAYWTAAKNSNVTASHPFYGSGETPQLGEWLDAAHTVRSSNTDWQDEVYSEAWTHNLSASVANSSKNGSVMFSLNYVNQDGLVDYTFYRRYSARLNSTYNIGKYVKVGENLMVANWQDRGFTTNADRGVPAMAIFQHPAIPVYDINGDFARPMYLSNSDFANPVQTIYNGRDNTNNSWRIFGNGFIEVTPVKGLTLKSNIGIEHVQYFNKTLNRKVNPSDRNNVNRAYGSGDTWTWTNTANYNLDIDDHHLNVLGGVEAIKYAFEDLSATRYDYAFEDDSFMQIGAGTGDQTNGGGKNEWALFSLFAKADYNYADRYLLSATIRRDATSRLWKGQNSGIFPAFSAAWRLSEEKFFPKNDIVNDVKVRVGWGQNGNAAIDNFYAGYTSYAYTSGNGAYDMAGTNNSVIGGVIVSASGNKNLKWETTTQTNIGLDLRMFNNSFGLSLDYFIKNTKDMLTQPPVLSVAGENAVVYRNTGSMKNHGFELVADYHSKQYGDFSWDGSFNFSLYRNEVEKLNDYVSFISAGDWRIMEGQPMGVYYGYVADGLFRTEEEVYNSADQEGKGLGRIRYRDLDGNGVINENDRCVIGDPNPDFSLGLNLSFKYKRFTLSTFFTGEFGFDIYNIVKKQLDFMGTGLRDINHGAEILNAWSPENPNSNIPALALTDANNEMRMSTYFIEDGSYFKMKYIKLQYDLPSKLAKKFCQGLSVYGQVENVFTITGYSGLDPELPLSSYGARVDNSPYPRSRTFSIGLNLQF